MTNRKSLSRSHWQSQGPGSKTLWKKCSNSDLSSPVNENLFSVFLHLSKECQILPKDLSILFSQPNSINTAQEAPLHELLHQARSPPRVLLLHPSCLCKPPVLPLPIQLNAASLLSARHHCPRCWSQDLGQGFRAAQRSERHF